MSTCKIYLVDDHPVYLEGLKNVLQKSATVEVVGHANDGAEALKYLESNQPEIIFIDIV